MRRTCVNDGVNATDDSNTSDSPTPYPHPHQNLPRTTKSCQINVFWTQTCPSCATHYEEVLLVILFMAHHYWYSYRTYTDMGILIAVAWVCQRRPSQEHHERHKFGLLSISYVVIFISCNGNASYHSLLDELFTIMHLNSMGSHVNCMYFPHAWHQINSILATFQTTRRC